MNNSSEKSIKDYVNERVEELTKEDEGMLETSKVYLIVEEVVNIYNVPCKAFHAGDFKSNGYDCYYYTIVWFDNNELYGVDVQCESY